MRRQRQLFQRNSRGCTVMTSTLCFHLFPVQYSLAIWSAFSMYGLFVWVLFPWLSRTVFAITISRWRAGPLAATLQTVTEPGSSSSTENGLHGCLLTKLWQQAQMHGQVASGDTYWHRLLTLSADAGCWHLFADTVCRHCWHSLLTLLTLLTLTTDTADTVCWHWLLTLSALMGSKLTPVRAAMLWSPARLVLEILLEGDEKKPCESRKSKRESGHSKDFLQSPQSHKESWWEACSLDERHVHCFKWDWLTPKWPHPLKKHPSLDMQSIDQCQHKECQCWLLPVGKYEPQNFPFLWAYGATQTAKYLIVPVVETTQCHSSVDFANWFKSCVCPIHRWPSSTHSLPKRELLWYNLHTSHPPLAHLKNYTLLIPAPDDVATFPSPRLQQPVPDPLSLIRVVMVPCCYHSNMFGLQWYYAVTMTICQACDGTMLSSWQHIRLVMAACHYHGNT